MDVLVTAIQLINNKVKGPMIKVRLPSENKPVTRCHLFIFGKDNDKLIRVEPLYDREINLTRNSWVEYIGHTDNSCSFQVNENVLRKQGLSKKLLNEKFQILHSNCKDNLDNPEKCVKEYSFYINSPSWLYSIENILSSWPIITICRLYCEMQSWKQK